MTYAKLTRDNLAKKIEKKASKKKKKKSIESIVNLRWKMEVGGVQRRYIILQVSASNLSQYVSLANIKLMYMYM